MRRRFSQSIVSTSLLLGIAGTLLSFVPPAARAQVNVNISAGVNFSAGLQINSAQDFYDPLGGYGAWFDMPPYGRVWQPAEVNAAWRPYEMGHWEWTDVGWYWFSDEPWAWATYHYGSWIDDPSYGWLWVPGTTWAPAWVVWRESPEYIGWAPCGPNGLVVAAPLFAFVDIHRFHGNFGPRDFIFNNTTIINRTRVINNFRTVDRTFDGGVRRRVVMNEGPSVNVVERAAGTRFTARPIRDVISREPAPSTVQRRSSDLNIQRPALREDSTTRGGNYRDRQPIRRGQEQNGSSATQGNRDRSGSGATPQLQRQSQQERQQQQQQRNINPVSPTGRQQQQTYPQTSHERQTVTEQPRSITPTPQTPQTTPPRTSQPAEIDRTRSSRDNLNRTAPSQPATQSPSSTARPDQGPSQRPSQFEPGQRPTTTPSSPRERSSELNREPRSTTSAPEKSSDINRNVKTPPQTLPPPTGREQPRTYPPAEAAPSRPVPERPDARQSERPTPPPPAAQERAPQEAPREQARPAQPPAEHPAAPPSRPEPSKERDKERDRP